MSLKDWSCMTTIMIQCRNQADIALSSFTIMQLDVENNEFSCQIHVTSVITTDHIRQEILGFNSVRISSKKAMMFRFL